MTKKQTALMKRSLLFDVFLVLNQMFFLNYHFHGSVVFGGTKHQVVISLSLPFPHSFVVVAVTAHFAAAARFASIAVAVDVESDEKH